MKQINNGTTARKPIRRSWLNRLLRDERGAAYSSDAAIVCCFVIAAGAAAAPVVTGAIDGAVRKVMGDLGKAVGTGAGANTAGGGAPAGGGDAAFANVQEYTGESIPVKM